MSGAFWAGCIIGGIVFGVLLGLGEDWRHDRQRRRYSEKWRDAHRG